MLVAAGPAVALDWRIESFEVEVEVRDDGGLDVVERIAVQFDGPHHGIYRDIPVRTAGRNGVARDLRLRVDGVVDTRGHVWRYRVRRSGDTVRIRIGDPERQVVGPQVYVLHYRVERAVAFFPEHDELYWNVTGNGWPVPIASARARVRLPEGRAPEKVAAEAFTGVYGARGRGAETRWANGVLEVQTREELAEWEGLSLAFGWPKGIVHPPGLVARTADAMRYFLPLLLPVAVAGFTWRRWRRYGRDPVAAVSVAVQYEPPRDLTPSEVGALADEKVDMRDITASVIDLAVRGHLRIETQETRYLGFFERQEIELVRREPPSASEPLGEHEEKLLAGLFDGGSRVQLADLRQKFYVHLEGIRHAVYDSLVRKGLFVSSPERVRRRYVGAGVAFWIVGGLLAALWVVRQGASTKAEVLPAVAAVGLAGAILIAVARVMPRRTRRGVEALAQVRGLQEFIARVEAPRLAMLEREGLDLRAHFERVLPYALALGVGTRWAQAFSALYTTPPEWYAGASGGRFTSLRFVNGLERVGGTMASNMASAPRSSGGSGLGGGGFSGGGGGGGGGGAW